MICVAIPWALIYITAMALHVTGTTERLHAQQQEQTE
jgi:hypothetical protein